MRTAIVTAVHGRTAHLRRQLEGLARSTIRADGHVLVAIDDDRVADVVPRDDDRTCVVPVHSTTHRLPMGPNC